MDGNACKLYATLISMLLAPQATLRRNTNSDPRLDPEAAKKKLGDLQLSVGSKAIFIGRSHFGCVATVIPEASKGLSKQVRQAARPEQAVRLHGSQTMRHPSAALFCLIISSPLSTHPISGSLGSPMCAQGKQLEIAGASGLLSVSVQPADPSTTQAAQRAKHMLATSKVRPRGPVRMRQDMARQHSSCCAHMEQDNHFFHVMNLSMGV